MDKYWKRNIKRLHSESDFYFSMAHLAIPDPKWEFFDKKRHEYMDQLFAYLKKGKNSYKKFNLYNRMYNDGTVDNLARQAELRADKRTGKVKRTKQVIYGMGITIVKNPGDTLFIEGPDKIRED